MKELIYYSLILMCLFSCTTEDTKTQDLFLKDSGTWFEEGDATWEFADNVLVGRIDSGSGFVMTKDIFSDFELTLEFKPDSTINSGVFVMCPQNQISATECYEINIWDLHPNQDFRTGSIVTRMSPLAIVNTIDRWNTYKISHRFDKIIITINGIKTAELEAGQTNSGYIALQAAGNGSIMFRNVEIQEF